MTQDTQDIFAQYAVPFNTDITLAVSLQLFLLFNATLP